LVIETNRDGLLIYDLSTDYAHWLDPEAAAVWESSDGSRDTPALSMVCGLGEPRVAEVLQQLREVGLIDDESATHRMDRRRLLGNAAKAAFGIAAVTSILAPTPAMAHSDICLSVGVACTGSGPDAPSASEAATDFCADDGNSELCFCECTPVLVDPIGGEYQCSGSCGASTF
jgi:hypothetical protein